MVSARQSVTVLMPVYNAATYLSEAVASILRQTYADFEFLIIDDGSTDGSTGLLTDLAAADRRIRLIVTGRQGVARALNLGLANASGSIIARMDADDIARPERLARQLAFLESQPEIAAAGTAMQLVDRSGRAIGVSRYSTGHDAIVGDLYRGNSPMAHPTVAFRRDTVISVGGYRPLFNYAEDFDLWFRLADRHRLANLPDILLDFRCHGQNSSNRYRREQALAAHMARLAAQERRRGRPDPTEGLDRLTVADLERFDLLQQHDRDAILLDLSEAGLTAYDASGDPRYLADIEESFFLHTSPHRERARRIARRLARHWWTNRRPLRSLAVIGWTARSEIATASGYRTRRKPKEQPGNRAGRNLAIDWMMHCADPTEPRTSAPHLPLPAEAAAYLVEQASAHRVLPAVLRNFPFDAGPAFEAARATAVQLHREILAMALMLQQQAEALTAAAAGLPVAIVKGPIFARTIYPGISSRPFTEIDLLVAPDAVAPLSAILEDQGLERVKTGHDPSERKWIHRDNAALMVEVHTNLVHAASLRHAMSLTYADIAGIADTPAAQLIISIVYGSLGGHFERLRNAADICQAARALVTAEDERSFAALVARTGAGLAARTGLTLACQCFNEPRCLEIAAALGRVRYSGLARLLIDRSVVRSAMTSDRWLHAWRRQAFRQLLKAGSRQAPDIKDA